MSVEKKPIDKHQQDYKQNAWESYTIHELGMWVHLFVKRANNRDNIEKAIKDLHDAKNYLWMVNEKIKKTAEKLGIDFEGL